MGKSHLRNFGLRVIRASAIENRFGRCRIVQDESYRALAILEREGLKRENIDASIGESLAELSKHSWPVIKSDGELLRGRHNVNLLTVCLGDGLGGVLRDSALPRILLLRGGRSKAPRVWAAFRKQVPAQRVDATPSNQLIRQYFPIENRSVRLHSIKT